MPVRHQHTRFIRSKEHHWGRQSRWSAFGVHQRVHDTTDECHPPVCCPTKIVWCTACCLICSKEPWTVPDVVFSGGEIVSSPNPPTVHTVMGSSAELQQPGLTNALYQENWNAINRSRCIFLLIMEQNRWHRCG